MARPLRVEYEGALYHITSRGNERKEIFKIDEDRLKFLDILRDVNKRYNWICHAYCLMRNHYHLVIETPEGNLSKGMRQLNGRYTQFFNWRHRRVGHLFQGRYKAILIQKDVYLSEVCRYVVLNPIRAGIVKDPGDWVWSSYRATLGLEVPHPCLSTEWLLEFFGGKREIVERLYRQFVMEGIGRSSMWEEVKGGCVLGEEGFIEEVLPYFREKKEILEIPKRERLMGRPTLRHIFEGAKVLSKKERNRRIIKAIYEFGYSQKEVADFLGMHYSTISRIVIQDSRPDPNPNTSPNIIQDSRPDPSPKREEV